MNQEEAQQLIAEIRKFKHYEFDPVTQNKIENTAYMYKNDIEKIITRFAKMNEELAPLTDAQLKLMFKLINEMPEKEKSEVGMIDASDVFDMIFKLNNPKWIEDWKKNHD